MYELTDQRPILKCILWAYEATDKRRHSLTLAARVNAVMAAAP